MLYACDYKSTYCVNVFMTATKKPWQKYVILLHIEPLFCVVKVSTINLICIKANISVLIDNEKTRIVINRTAPR